MKVAQIGFSSRSVLVFLATGAMTLALTLSACSNARPRTRVKTDVSTGITVTNGPAILSATMNLSGTPPTMTLALDSTRPPLTNMCSVSTGTSSGSSGETATQSCSCMIEWSMTNNIGAGGSTTGSTVLIPRSATLPLSSMNLYQAVCPLPGLSNIQEGSTVKVKIIGTGTNNSTYQSNTMATLYSSTGVSNQCSSASGAENCAIDQMGISYFNAIRYACFEYFQRDTAFSNQKVQIDPPDGLDNASPVTLPVANKFCYAGKQNQNAGNLQPCNIQQLEYTAQSNYYNLLARSNNPLFTQQNQNYFCPRVRASDVIFTQSNQQFPGFPATPAFMVASTWSTENSVGVEAPTVLGSSGSQSNNRTFCRKRDGSAGAASVASANNEIAAGCVGYVAARNSTGGCSPKMVGGQLRMQYPLRRYIAKFPPLFKSSGHIDKNSAVFVDQFYVLDRPVGLDPTEGLSMRGPLPCPQAYFDRKAVTENVVPSPVSSIAYTFDSNRPYMPGYVATNSDLWTNRNVDGIAFPNRDTDLLSYAPASCSAALPIYHRPSTLANDEILGIATIHASNANTKIGPPYVNEINLGRGRILQLNDVHVRPLDPFVPEYIEDESFQACALEPQGGYRSPMHFFNYSESNKRYSAYCEEIYPTQNDNVASLDRPVVPMPAPNPTFTPSPYPGAVMTYTSHVVTPQSLANIKTCTATQLTSLPTGLASPGAYAAGATPGTGQGTYLANLHHANTFIEGGGPANHTCDRTVDNTGGSGQPFGFPYFPLLAAPNDVNDALNRYKQYRCSITKDLRNDGRAGVDTPTGGCSRIVGPINSSAHAEPEHVHLPPQY